MKNLVKTFVLYIAAGVGSTVGLLGGAWLWSEVLEEKADKMKNRFSNKSKEEEGL